MAKVHVVGAGPSGSIAAISALRSGHSVIMSEDHPVSGLPENCSGLFSKDGLESLSGFLDYRKHIIRPIYGADIYLIDQKLEIRRSDPVGFVCNRSAIDQDLAACASSEGASINYHERIKDSFHASNIIGADGPLSTVARHFKFRKINRYASTLQSIVEYKCENPNVVEVYISNNLFPGFFAWVIPHDEYTAEFGVGVEIPNRPLDAWNHLLDIKGIHNRKLCCRGLKGAIIPIRVRRTTAMRHGKYNVLLVGDAAGQVKSTTGGGVIFGGNCAMLAGKHALEPERYEVEWRLRHGPDLALHSMVHDYLASQSDSALSSLGARLKKLNIDGYLSRNGHMDRPTKMVQPNLLSHMVRNVIGLDNF